MRKDLHYKSIMVALHVFHISNVILVLFIGVAAVRGTCTWAIALYCSYENACLSVCLLPLQLKGEKNSAIVSICLLVLD